LEGGNSYPRSEAVRLRDFVPKAPSPKTAAWYAIVNANMAPESSELADRLDAMGDMQFLGDDIRRPDTVSRL
jgi:hypothetical protein